MIKTALHNILQDNKNQISLHLDQGVVTYGSPRDNQICYETSFLLLGGNRIHYFRAIIQFYGQVVPQCFLLFSFWSITNFQVNTSNKSILISFSCSHFGQWAFISQNVHSFQQHNVTNNKISSLSIPFLTLLQLLQVFRPPTRPELIGYMLHPPPSSSTIQIKFEELPRW